VHELHKHIQSVYGSFGQVFINILPTPTATPQKPSQLASHAPVDPQLLPTNFADLSDINLEATTSAMTFDFDNPDADMGYESSSYYTSDALSPSPMSSPRQKSIQTFLENIAEDTAQEMSFGQAPALLPSAMETGVSSAVPFTPANLPHASLSADLDIDATIEYTGISAEEVQRYISEQDPQTNKWTCLYPECGKIFGRRENIRSHVQTHLGDRQYRCNGCGKASLQNPHR
jgi:regulatory protein SWI5